MRGTYHQLLMCNVLSVTYYYEGRIGRLEVPQWNYPDMDGCIAYFKNIDPNVASINVRHFGSAFQFDAHAYMKVDGRWTFVNQGAAHRISHPQPPRARE